MEKVVAYKDVQKWLYTWTNDFEHLKQLGHEGWEAYAVTLEGNRGTLWHLKRPG